MLTHFALGRFPTLWAHFPLTREAANELMRRSQDLHSLVRVLHNRFQQLVANSPLIALLRPALYVVGWQAAGWARERVQRGGAAASASWHPDWLRIAAAAAAE